MQPQQNTPAYDSPFHAGESRVQSRLGVRDTIEPWARQVVRDRLPDQHRQFYSGLPFVVAAARDHLGRPWSTLIAGRPGFIRSPDDRSLLLETRLVSGDALRGALDEEADLGLLGIDLETRRRNRVNGRAIAHGDGLRLNVLQSFGNCPQYIHERNWEWVDEADQQQTVLKTTSLSAHARDLIESADTLFIASGYRGQGEHPAYGMDASHRGGAPGFVKVLNNRRLAFPDYAGNNHFNTIGNLVLNPGVGLLFVDFATGGMLQITGRACIDWDSDSVAEHPGAQRLVVIDMDEVVYLANALPLRWSAAKSSVRTLRLVDKIKESADATSFVFHSRDDGPLPEFEAGQHLPVEVRLPGSDAPSRRTYSLSNGPGSDHYRITVKREPKGAVSRYLHDQLEVGDMLDATTPGGDFVLAPGDRPIALVSAGIGITPMVSMLHQLAKDPLARSTWFIHGARNGSQHALADEVRAVTEHNAHINSHVAYSRPQGNDQPGLDHHSVGRVDAELVASLLPDLNAEFYLCGPTRFLSDLKTQLEAAGVHPDHVHAETFGPVASMPVTN